MNRQCNWTWKRIFFSANCRGTTVISVNGFAYDWQFLRLGMTTIRVWGYFCGSVNVRNWYSIRDDSCLLFPLLSSYIHYACLSHSGFWMIEMMSIWIIRSNTVLKVTMGIYDKLLKSSKLKLLRNCLCTDCVPILNCWRADGRVTTGCLFRDDCTLRKL